MKTETLITPIPVELEFDKQGYPNAGMMPSDEGSLVLVHINNLETKEMLAWTHFTIAQFREFIQHVEASYKAMLNEWKI